MSTPATPVEPEVISPEEYKRIREEADKITAEDITSITVNLPPLQSAPMVAKQTFAKFFGVLKTLRTAYAEAPIDCTTTAGEKAAREIWRKLVTLRTRSDKVRLEQNRVFIEQQKANNDEYGMLMDAILPIEQRFENAIREKERAVEAARLKREEDARQKAAAVTQAILDISAKADNLIGLSSGDISARLQEVQLIELSEAEFEHRYAEAVTIKDRTISRLELALAEKEKAERDAAQVEADRKRFAEEKAEREEREAAERAARTAINGLFSSLARAGELSMEELESCIGGMESIDFQQFAPLQDEARDAVARVLPAITKIRDERAVAQAERAESLRKAALAEKEANARQRIAAMKATVADSVGASSASIAAAIEAVKGLLMAEFEPFVKEAEEEQGRVLTSLEKLRIAAEADERTAAEREQREARANEVQRNINALSSIAANLQAQGFSSASVKAASDAMSIPTEAEFGDRLNEAMAAFDAQKRLLSIMFQKADEAEKAAAEKAAAEQRQREEEQRAEDQRQLDLAAKTRREQVLAANAAAMFSLLEAIRADGGYASLSEALRSDIDGLTGSIVAAF